MMKRSLLRSVFVVACLTVMTWALAAGGQQPGNYVPGQVIIKLSPSTPLADAMAVRASLNATVERRFESVGAELWKISGIDVQTAVGQFKNDPRIAYIEPDYIVHAEDVFPNDPRFTEMWALHNTGQTGGTPDADIDAPEAWSSETGDTVLVGVIDTGVDWHHVELAANIFTNPGEIPSNGVDDDGNGYVDDVHGWDFVNNDNDPYDDHGHGTHVSGTIAAIGNNGVGVVGVSWSARILPLKFLDAGGSGSTSDAILAVEYATAMAVRLTSNSWGGGGYSQALRDAIEAVGDAGILFVAAAGNDASNNDVYPHYPSSYDLDNIIAVASTDHNDQMSWFSCYGLTSVDLAAPGSDILSTLPGNRYGTYSGTSMATPHVSGAVCLLWAAAPMMTHLDVKNTIMSSVDVIPALQGMMVAGGRLNVYNMLSGLDSIPPAPATNLAVQSTGSNTVTLTWTATGDDTTTGTASVYDLRYSASGIDSSNFDSATRVQGLPRPKPAGSPESFMVRGLDFNTKYFFGLVVEDEQGNRSWLSNVPNGTTLGVPQLTYSPDSFTASLQTGGSTVQLLTIENTGEGTLDFTFPGAQTEGLGVEGAPAVFPTWLRVDPPSGRVNAGGSLVVEVTFDATGMYAGDYAETFVLETNDPDQQAVPIPVSLHVTNAPDVAVSPSTIDYGVRYTGTCVTDTVLVTNIGTEPLVVTGLTIDNSEYSTDPSGFVLGIGQSRIILVAFCPVIIGAVEGTLAIQSNDPDHPTYSVPLRGQGVAPPVISVSPDSLWDDLYTGQIATQMLTISNSGGSDLEWEVVIEDLGGPTSLGVELRAGGDVPDQSRGITPAASGNAPISKGPSYAGDRVGSRSRGIDTPAMANGTAFDLKILLLHSAAVSEIRDLLLAFPDISVVDVFDGGVATPTLATLTAYDAVILINNSAYLDPVGIGNVLADYADTGGGVIMTLASFISGWDVRGRFANGGYYPFTLGTGPVDTATLSNYDPNHPIMAGVTSAQGDLLGATYVASGAVWVADWSNGYPFIATQGDHVAGVNIFLNDGGYWAGDIPLVLHNAVVWSVGATWLVVTPTEGVVPPDGSVDVEVTFNAAGLYGGNYDARLHIANNDPNRPKMVAPAHLHVTGAPDIAVSDTVLNYGPVFIGAVVRKTLVVSNQGTDELVVSGIASSHGNYTVDVTSFNLAPGASQNVVVSLAPTTTGPIPGTLTITSNDVDEGVVEVDLWGEGLVPPVISVTADSLADSLFTGETSTHMLTISNTGGSDLDFEIAVAALEGAQGKMEMFADASLPKGVIGVGRPLPPGELDKLKAHFPKNVVVGAQGEIDRGTSSVKRAGEGMVLDRVERTDLEEVFGSDENLYTAGPRTRGNLFTCTTSATLIEHRLYMNPTASTQMWFLVYQGDSQVGIYQLVSASDVTPGGPGLGWYSSGDVRVPLEAGKFYLIVASFEQETSYFNEQDISLYPIPASFGELTAGAGWDWAPTSEFPPAPYQDVPSDAIGSPVAYYQALVTGSVVRWLSAAPEEGIVLPSTSMAVTVRFDATGMNGGDYDANILVASNDPITPVVEVPARLHVTGAPDIAVSDTVLNYGPVFIGAVVRKTLVVSNEGTDGLVVSGISSSHENYAVDVTSFNLAPGAKQDVVVSYAPTTPGPIPGTLTITSDDVDEGVVEVDLWGEGLVPPVISVTPDSLADSLFTGETSTHTLSISNTGGSNLVWTAHADAVQELGTHAYTLTAPVAGVIDRETGKNHPAEGFRTAPISATLKDLTGVAILVDCAHGEYTGDRSVIFADVRARGATVTENFDPITSTLLEGYDLMWVTDFFSTWTPSEIQAVQTWFLTGGALLFESDETQTGLNTLIAGLGTGITYLFSSAVYGVTTAIYPHETTQGVSSAYLDNPLAALDVAAPAGRLVDDMLGNNAAAYSEVASGRIFAVSDEIFSDWAIGLADNQLFTNQVIDWLSVGVEWLSLTPTEGTVAPGGSQDVTVILDATGQYGGDYDANIVISNNDPLNSEVPVAAHLHVTGAPDIAVSDSVLDYGPAFIGVVVRKTLVVSNEGTDELVVSEISSSDDDYTVDVASFNVAPGASQNLAVTFAPTTAGPIPATLTITSNDVDEGVAEVSLRGEGLVPPVISVTPDSLADSLFTGQSSTQQLTIDNSAGGSDLIWNISAQYREDTTSVLGSSPVFGSGSKEIVDSNKDINSPPTGRPDPSAIFAFPARGGGKPTSASATTLETVLANLNANYNDVITAIPNRFDFSDGEWGYYIDDGGNDMYDGGNYLATDLGGSIEYSNDAIASSPYFGNGGRYFTKKYPGLFVLVADMEGVNHFEITGNLGADGSGYADGAFLQARVSGINFYGFVKRVYGAGDPSVNHLIIIEENPAATHEFATNTDDDYHRVFNLTGCRRIYYALYAGADGLYIDNAATLNIMETFLNSLGLAPEWVRIVPGLGTVPAGSNTVVDVTFDATGQFGGDYGANIVIANNDPLKPKVVVPAHLHVTGAPDIAVSDTVLNYGPLFIGATATDTLAMSNEGTDELVVSEISSSDEDYTVDVTSFNLAPGASQHLVVTFAPTTAGPIPATLTITSNDPDEGVMGVGLQGVGVVPPVISVTPDSLACSLFTGQSSTDSLTICNTGGSDLTFRVDLQTGTQPTSAVSVRTATRRGSGDDQFSRAIVAQPEPTDVESNGLSPDETAGERFDVQNGTAPMSTAIMFSDGFEDGDFDGWGDGAGSGTKEVTNATAANGTMYSYHEHGSPEGHFNGVYQVFGAAQPGYIGFHIRSGSTTDDDAYVVLRNSSGYEAICFFARGSGFLYCNADVGGDRSVAYEVHRWYHIEFRDIDFTAKTFDYYVDDDLVKADISFRNSWAIEDIYRMDLYNFTTGAEAWWDEFWMSTGKGPADWLSVVPISGTITAGSCTDLFVTFDAAGMYGGDYDANIVIANNDPLTPKVVVPARLHVTGAPDIVVSDTLLDYGPLFIGAVANRTLVVSNGGTDVLVVSDVSSDETDYTVDVTNFTLDPGASRPVAVTFAPKATGPRLATLTITSNDPDEGVMGVGLQGVGVVPPVISVTPDSLAESLFTGESSTQQLTIDNSAGGSELIWNVSVRHREDTASVLASSPVFGSGSKGIVNSNKNNDSPPTGRPDPSGLFTFASRGQGVTTSGTATSLETILSHLNANYAGVTGAIPNRFDFSEGEGGYCIDDGGLDMYDRGNYLWTDLGGPVGYSNDCIVSVPCFGSGGRYFTRKYPGLFVLVADMEGVNHFEITGDLGADSVGYTDGALLQAQVAGVNFYGFVKRVYSAGDPSVNHLIIIEENPAATHEFATNTNDDYHRVFNLTGCRRIYYAVYAGANGFYIDDTATLGIMEAFLNSVDLAPEWVRVVPTSGTVPAGEGTNVDVTFAAMGMKGGDYDANILVTSNDPIKPEVTVPTHLNVARSSCGIPEIVSHDPILLNQGNCSEGCTISFIVDTQDDYSTVAKITLERYLQGMWIPEDSLFAPLPAPTWTLTCDIDGHYTDGEHMFHVVFHCGDGSKGVSETTTIIADRGVPIAIRSFEPEYSKEGIILRWSVADRVTLQGFNIYKSLREEAGFGRINTGLIPADQDNEYVDMDVSPAKTYWYRLGAVAVDGEWMSPTVSITVPVLSLTLYQNAPNPFNPTTSIPFTLPDRSRVTLCIYDVEGRRIRILVDEVIREGYQERIWDARDASGNQVGSGVYFYRLTAGDRTLTKKMVLLK